MKWNHAIIGCGRIAPNHVFGAQSYGVSIKSCCDNNLTTAETFSKRHLISTCTDDYKVILNDPSIDSVSICTDHKSHYNLTIEALRAGKNVLTEKPICTNVDDAKEMIALSKKCKKVLAVISQHRYNSLIKEIRNLITDNTFGDLTLVNGSLNCSKDEKYYSNSSWRGRLDKEGGSTLINQAIHTLDLICWILGQPKEVQSFGSILKFQNVIDTEDTLVAIMKFESGLLGTFSTTNTSIDEWDSKIQIIGTKGTIIFSTGFPSKVIEFQLQDKTLRSKILKNLDSLAESKDDVPTTMNYYGTTHREQMADFFEVSMGLKKKLEMLPEEALKTLITVKELYKYN